jgi:DNA primase
MSEGIDLATMDGKARLSKLVAPYINLIPDGVFKTLLFKSLADRTDMDVDSLRRLREIERLEDPSEVVSDDDGFDDLARDAQTFDDQTQAHPDRGKYLERDNASIALASKDVALLKALGLIVLKPSAATVITEEMLPEAQNQISTLLNDVVKQVRETPDLSTAALLGYWMGTDEGEALSAAAAKEVMDDEEHINEHVIAILNKVSRDRRITILRKRAENLKSVAYTDLSHEQKRELVTLTTEIRQLSGRS